ncbi:MAG: molybdate ABC transporter substrate-binding protein [Pseudomonadota bacterium]
MSGEVVSLESSDAVQQEDIAEQGLQLYAAGSLAPALSALTRAFSRRYGIKVKSTFGPSGLLRKKIDKGQAADLFASADVKHAASLMKANKGGPVAVFAHNSLCAIAQQSLKAATTSLLDLMLDTNVRLATSTPKSDPAGDYTWEVFKRADITKPGSFKTLSGKAIKLTGGATAPEPPKGHDLYAWLMQEDRADIILTYRTNALRAAQENHFIDVVELPEVLAVDAEYGVIVLNDRDTTAWKLAMFMLSTAGQKILARHGFDVQGAHAASE